MEIKKPNNKDSNYQTSVHYANAAHSYDQSFFQESGSDYQRWQLSHLLHHLCLKPTDQVVDLGCGTGGFTSTVYTTAGLNQNILAVDPSQSMLNEAQKLPGITICCSDIQSFVENEAIRYDKVLMQGVVHHIPIVDLPEVYSGIYEQLHPGGILLTVTRPVIVNYPFFQAASEVWLKQTQSHTVDALATYMKQAGFSVCDQIHHYPVKIPKNQWFEMIRNRFFSTFSYFSDEELEAGITELTTQYAQTDIFNFQEALIFIEALKS